MIKQILPLLFTFIFSMNLFAESHDIHREISDIKLQLQEIKLLDARDERENKLEKLEKDIKELEEKFNQNNIDKKDIDGKIVTQDKLINIISISIGLFGILITGIVIFFAFKFEKIAKGEAKEESKKEVENWIKENKNRILEPIINEGNNLLKNIRKEADILLHDYQLSMKNHNLKNELDSKEKDILEKVNILLESKETENYTFNDWYSKFLDYYYKVDFDNAIKALDNALNVTNSEYEIVGALLDKGVTLGISKEGFYKAIKVYDELVDRFKDSKEERILKRVISALLNKIEINLILGNKNLERDLDLYFDLVKENKQELLGFEMLQILEKAKNLNQEDEIKAWQIKFKDIKMENWSFLELKTWAETLENEAKERILKYIDIFENHNKNIKGK